MKETSDINSSASNIISFKKYKDKKPDEVTSTIAVSYTHLTLPTTPYV